MAEIQNFLSGLKSKDGNSNLYDHITNILGKMLLDNPTNPYDNIESYSHDVKFSNFDYKKDTNFDHKDRMRETYGEIKEWADKALSNLEVIFRTISKFFHISNSLFDKRWTNLNRK